MFPARVGMNRQHGSASAVLHDVPRACGDEPSAGIASAEGTECSPRVWG